MSQATAPDNFIISLLGFNMTEDAEAVGEVIGCCTRELSRLFDLSSLDGVTVAYDYTKALQDLDRGYDSNHQLTPSEGNVVGIAMTPCVMRDGRLKSHIVLSAGITEGINDVNGEKFQLFLQTLAHECAHVEITSKFDVAFPKTLLRECNHDIRIAFQWDVTLACWDEYAATRLSSRIGLDMSGYYEESFLKQLGETQTLANECIKQYRTHGDYHRVLSEVSNLYGRLLKLSAYYLGSMDGHERDPFSQEEVDKRGSCQWFEEFLHKLHDSCQEVFSSYGRWRDKSAFEKVGNLAEELLAHGGIIFEYSSAGQLRINIPYSADTMPSK